MQQKEATFSKHALKVLVAPTFSLFNMRDIL